MSNTRLIDANALRQHWLECGENEYIYDTNAVLDSIDDAPTVEAEQVKRGEWLDVEYNPFWKIMMATCSSCSVRGRCDLREMSADLLSPIRLGAQTAAHICLREV